MTENCRICCEIKPRFFKPPLAQLVKSTQPFERISIDFKGPLPSTSQDHYFLTLLTSILAFLLSIPVPILARKLISCLTSLFNIFGFPAVVHSDNAKCFVSREIKQFLTERGISTTFATVYNPRGNSQCESYNGVIWNAVRLALRTNGMEISRWESVLPQA